jgi:putative hydrolase
MEINTGHDHIEPAYVRIAFEAGAHFVINSDAHRPCRVGEMQSGVRLVQAAGIPMAAIHNMAQEQET